MKLENILTSPTFENAKTGSNDLSGHGRTFRRLFSGAEWIGVRPDLRNIFRQAVAYLLILLFTLQPSAVIMASDRSYTNPQPTAEAPAAEAAPGYFEQAYNWLSGNTAPAIEAPAPPPPPPPPTISEAAISRHYPSLNGGTIDGSLRVFSGESYAINSQFHLNGDLYAVGTPNITVNSGASHGGVINDGGTTTPTGYGITLNSGVVLPGKIHIRANPIALPSGIPTSVPSPSGTRTVNINSPADLNNIGNWATLRNLNVNPSNLVINVPPGNYDTFSLNGPNIRLVFTAGTYNFSGTVNLNSASNIQSNGAVTINIGQNLNLNNGIIGVGSGTASSDVKLNVVGSTLSVNNNSQVWALVRAVNATVNLNAAIIRGHVIANYLNINSGQIIGDANPADTTAPTLAITSPANNSTTTSATVNVTGTASDAGSGITSVTVNNLAASYNAGAGTWSFANLSLALGSNVITVKATDGAGNITTQTVTVTRQLPPDVTVPAVAITSPATNTTVQTATITVSGTASDTGPGATGINRVMVNGVQAAYNSGTGTWTISGVQLNEGANTITATAFDNAPTPNSSQASITVTRFTPDTQAPTIAITSPSNNSTVPDATVTVSGTVSDTGLNATGVNRVMVNGVQAVYNSAAGTWTISGVALNEGANTITAIAYDNAPTPNSSQTSITVTRTTPDTTPPTVAITSPANNTTVPDATVTVSGTVSDTGLNASGVNRVMVNGVQASYNSAAGTWTISGVQLNEGANTITAIAYDNAPTPNSSQASITVTRTTPDTTPPTVAITSPADNTTVPDATVTVSGTVSDTGLNASGVNRVMVNGVQASYDSGTGTWTISGVQLNEGANTITAIAYDNAPTPNSSQTSITVTRFTPDTQAPTVAITSPADGSQTYSSTATITGLANDEGLNAAGVASVTVNGQTASYDANTHQWTAADVPLAIGDNTITVTIVDSASPANQVQTVIHIIRQEIPPPTITITSPANNSATTAGSITVSGSAAAFSTGDNHITQVTVNDIPASFDPVSGTWTFANFPLTLGSNVITAKATDSGGRETSAQITVLRDPVNQGPVAVDDVYRINEADPQFNIKLPFKFSAASYLSGSPFNSIIGMVAAENGKLYVSDSSGAIIAVDLATRATTTVTTLPYARPRNMIIGDASFGGGLIVSDHNSTQFSSCCTGEVLKIDPTTGQVTVLSDGNPSYPGFADPFGLALSSGGAFPAGAYVMDFEGSSPHPPNLFRIAGDGTRSPFLTNPSIWTTERFPTYLIFGPGGDFGNDLFVADSLGLATPPAIWRVNAQGAITSFVSGEPLRAPGIMRFGRGGIFGTDLYVLDNQLKSIFRITAGGTISVFARDLPLTEGLSSMEFSPDGQSLFVGAGNKLIRITSPASLSVIAPGVLANDTDNENDPLTAAADTNPSHGTLTFNSNGSFDYTAGDSFTGTDSFTYHASDGTQSSNIATVTINNIVNQAPAINAGPNQTVSLPSAANLNGTVTDDGLPSGALVTNWSLVTGPAAVSFGNAAQAVTSANFSATGTYVLRLTATDGELSIADDITIVVTPQNNAPTVNAGTDQTVTLPAAINLDGSASDDGLPQSLSVSWTKVSGAGDVSFANPGSTDTTACFTASGAYVLRLTATDGQLTVSDDVTVTIRTVQTQEIKTGNGEIGQTEPNLQFSRNGGATWQPAFIIEKYDSSVYFPGTNNRWGQIPGTKWVNFVNSHWTAGVGNTFGGVYTAKYRTTFNLPADYSEPSIKGLIEVDNEATVYLNGVQIAFHNIFVDPPATFFNNNPALFHAGENVIEIDWVDLGGGIGGLDYQMLVSSVDSGSQSNRAPIVYAGPDQTIYPPSVTQLNGVVRDDYLPSCGSNLSISWTKVSGPGSAVFANPNSGATTVSFSALGTYVLRLTGSDGVSTVSDDVTINALAENQPPQVSAGPDREVRLPDGIALSGTATDDGIPPPAQLSKTWSKVSGPGSVTFTAPSSLQTTATFGASGTYVLRLTASDSALSSSDETTVTVYPETAACPSDDFIDDFNDNLFDTQKWSITNPASPMVVSEQGQRLRITLAPNTAEYNSVFSNQAFDLTNKSFSVQVVDPGSQAGWVSTFVFLELDGNNSYRMSAGAGSAVYEIVSGGVSTQRLVTSYNYQPFWRIRHDSFTNQVRFESSTNGQTWTLQHSVTPTISLNSLNIRMGTGAYGTGNSSPGQAIFDNVRLVSVHPNCLPTVSITQPAENSTFPMGTTSVPIEAAAADTDGTISKVEFFADGVKIGESTAGPYVFNWGGAPAGQHTLTAKATDDRGASVISAPVHITVLPPALCYQNDDFNDNAIDLAKWLAPPADGQVYERNQRLEIIPFSQPYRDSNGSIKYNGYLTAAECDYTGIATSVEIVQATPFEYGVETDFRWIIGLPNYSSINVIGMVFSGPNLGFYYYVDGVRSITVITPDPVAQRFWRIRHISSSDEIVWETSPDNISWTIQRRAPRPFPITSIRAMMSSGTYLNFPNPGTAIYDNFVISREAENLAPVVNAGPDQSVFTGNAATLAGSVSDDGLPGGSTVSAVWSTVSGPGAVAFADVTAPATTASFSQTGSYVLRLTATDSVLTASDDVTITVLPPNQPPVADFSVPSAGGPLGLTVNSFSSPGSTPSNLLDESTFSNWMTASGQNTNQFIKFELIGGEQLIRGFRFQQGNYPASYMVKDFIVQVSTTTSDDAAFSTVLTGTLQTNLQLQEINLPADAVHAKFVKFIAVNNHGGEPQIILSTFQVIGAGKADSIVSLPGSLNAVRRASPSLLKNGAAISRSSSYGSTPVELINGGAWKTNSKVNEFVVIKLADDKSHLLRGIRMGGNYLDYINYWVQDFEVWVSNTVDEDTAFTKVLDGVKTTSDTEDFIFPGGEVPAKYIKYVPKSSRGNATFIGTFAIEALAVETGGIYSFSSDYENSRVERAFDNNPQTAWYCAPGRLTDQWVKLRLDGTVSQKVYGVRIGGNNSIFGAFGPRDYQIRVSKTTADDSAFTVIHSGTLTASGAMQEVRFAAPVDAKYVQFYWLNGYSPDSWLSVYELEVLALSSDGAIFTNISSQATMSVPAARILDLDQGPNYGQWESVGGQNTDQSLTLRLYDGRQFDIRHIALRPGLVYPQTSMAPKDFEIQVSTTDDAESSFTTVFSGTAQPADLLQHFYFPTVSARYVRLFLRNNYGNTYIGLNTFFVFAENTSGTDARFFDRSGDSDGSIVSYQWDFGDGSTGSGPNPAHNYAQEGIYNVSLTVTDSGGATNTTVKPYHALPTLKADFAYSPVNPVESDWYPNTVYFVNKSSSRLTNAGGGEFVTMGTVHPISGQSFPAILYPDNGSHPATIRLGSDYVLNYQTTKNVAVQNLPPGVDITDGKTVYWGENWTNTVIGLGDPGPADRATLSGVWNFGDGTSSTCSNCTAASAQGAHAYALPGEYTAVLTITDKDGGSGSDSANYNVIKRPTAVVFNPPVRNGSQLTISGTLFDSYANLPLAGKPVQVVLNGFATGLTTDGGGAFQTTVALDAGSQIGQIISYFAEDSFYQGSSNVYSAPPIRDNPPSGTPSNGGTDFWLAFPANYTDGLTSEALLITSETDTSGTVTAAACGVNQTFQVTARTVTQIPIHRSCQLFNSNVVENLGIHVTAQAPVVVYGLNERPFTTDAFLALPVNTLGWEYYALAYGNQNGFVPSSQFGVVATENNTVITITPSVTTDTRPQGIPYQISLNQGQTYLLKNTEIGDEKDLTGSSIAADKPVAVFGGHQAATLPAPTVCCADHLVEQMPPVNTWGKRFLLVPSATRTKGDFFRVVAAYDNTVIYLNGSRSATINKGQFFEKLVLDPSEVIATEPVMVGQYSTSSGFDTATYGGDPFMAIVPPYSQFLNHYTISTPNRFNNYINLAVPTSVVGQVVLDGAPVAANQFTSIGTSGFSSARVPIAIGTHNLDAPAPFGVLSYGYSADEGYGYPGGMSLIPSVRSTNLTLNPETAAFGINSQGCATASLKDENNDPLGGRTVSFNVLGANPTNGSGATNASGQSQFCYTGANPGSDTITASFDSVTASSTFIWSAVNQPPAVNAGNDQSITLPAVANLSGAAADDGYPSNTLTYAWSKVSGPGDVTFGAPNALATTAAFGGLAGAYVLRLTVSDGEFSVSDDVTVTVAAGNVNQPPTANAGPDQTATLNANLLRNPGAESDLIGGELPNWTEVQGSSWTRVSESAGGPPARFGRYTLNAGAPAQAELRQDVDLRAFSQGINDGTLQFTWKAFIRSLPEAAPDGGTVIVEYRDAANQNLIASLNSGEITTTGVWHETEDTRVPPAGTGFMRIRLIAQRHTGATNDVFFDGLSLRAEGPIAAVLLDGTTSDDGLPTGSTLQSTWTSISGPGAVSFANPSAADSPASFTVAGTYVLRLTASDGVLSASDDVTVTINPANTAPLVNAGADQTITLPNSAQLNGSVIDDGEPQGGVITTRWSKVSGPGSVTFSDAFIQNPTASFTAAGTYVLRLFAEDGDLEAIDEVTITVNAQNNPVNQPPTVEAGNNQTIQLPVNSVALNGTVTDDGLPNNSLSITWTKTSGPGNVSFANPNSAQTTASFDAAGSYVLRLTVSDGQYTSFDELGIIVNTAAQQNQPPSVTISPDQSITLSQQAILEALTLMDDGLPTGAVYTYQWSKVSGPGTVTFTNPTETATYATFSEVGVYVVRLTASDSELTGSDDATVTVTEDVPAPSVEILTPDDGISITEPTGITGTVTAGNWRLEYSLTDTDNLNNRSWTTAASGSGTASGTLGTLDTTLMLNGTYDVRLISDNNGQISSDIISVTVENNLKIGHFTVSFDDMSVPVAGVPIQIIRTYDSRDKRKGDFGYGWTLGVKNLRLEKNAILGLKWFQTRSQTFIPTYCVEPTRPHIVSVTTPDGKVQKFEAALAVRCQQAANITGGNVVFTPQAGAQGKLEVIGSNEVAVAGSVPGPVELIGFDGQGIFDRTSYKYTARDGTEFIIDQLGGLQSVKDTNNNTLTISSSGITHSSGVGISFTRDALGRITHVTDPAGKSNVYTYDAAGDLAAVKDREDNTTTFTYEPTIPHHLKSIIDPLGRNAVRNEYDASGRLIRQIDAKNQEVVFTHDLTSRVEIIRDRLGNETLFEYDARGNVVKKRDALNNETTFTTDGDGNVLTETNALGKTTTNTYDPQGNRTSVTDPLGNRTEYTHNSQGRPLTVKDARNIVTTNTYNTAGNLLTVADSLGNVTTNFYSIQTGKLTTTTDPQNNVTRLDYVGDLLTKQTDAQGHETTFGYDTNGNRTSQTVSRTNAQGQTETITTTSEFDNLNRLTKTILPDGSFSRTEYDETGRQKATIDNAGLRTEFVYDELGRVIKTTYPDGKFDESTYDAEGRRLTSKDWGGRVTSYEYDVLGRLKKTTYPDGTHTQTGYNAIGQVISSTDPGGNITTYLYDDAGRRIQLKNSLDQITQFTYDANGNQLTVKDALNHVTTNEYDELNRRVKTTYPDGTFVQVTYDSLNRKTAQRDQAGKITQFFYDSLGRLTKVKDALNQETRYEYDELGQQIKQIDALNHETRYQYDKMGRRIKRILPLGQIESVTYGGTGNLESKTDFNGKTTTFTYDNFRRLLAKTPDASLNQPSVSFTYNDFGQRATMTDASGTTSYAYDTRSRLTSKQTPFGTLSYTYNETGNIETVRSSNANGVSVDYDYDELNRLDTVKDNRLTGNRETTYTYDAVGNLQSYSYPNEVKTSYAYDNLNRLTTMTLDKGQTNLAGYAYTLGAAGHRTQVVENTGRTINYVYDDLHRLTQETIAGSAISGNINYSYDGVSNRLNRSSSVTEVSSQNSSYDANDRLESDTYDANGNTKISNGTNYNYDFENKLTSSSNGVTIVYDGDGNRVSKTTGGVTTNYLVDTNNMTGYAQVVEEIQGGSVVKAYTYGHSRISQRVVGGDVSFYGYDGHGSVRKLTDSIGNVSDSYSYDAFGNLLERTGTTENNYLYAGEQLDAGLGFYYNRARYLNVDSGRFMSMDSFEGSKNDPISLHKYLYAGADGVNKTDPSGNFSISESITVASIVSVLATIVTIGIGLGSAGLAGLYIPKDGFFKPSDATVLSFQLNVPIGRLFKPTNPLAIALRVGFAGLAAVFTIDLVIPHDKPEAAWLYLSAGVSAGFGQLRDNLLQVKGVGFSIGGSVGLAWQTKQPDDYAGPFFCTSISSSAIPEFGGRAIQGCGSPGGAYSATISITQPPKPVAMGSSSVFRYMYDMGGVVRPIRGSISSAISAWEEVAGSLGLE